MDTAGTGNQTQAQCQWSTGTTSGSTANIPNIHGSYKLAPINIFTYNLCGQIYQNLKVFQNRINLSDAICDVDGKVIRHWMAKGRFSNISIS